MYRFSLQEMETCTIKNSTFCPPELPSAPVITAKNFLHVHIDIPFARTYRHVGRDAQIVFVSCFLQHVIMNNFKHTEIRIIE